MNGRIEELKQQAADYVDSIDNGIDIEEYRKLLDQKFAELIVRECAIAFEAEVDTWKEMDPYQGSIKRQGTKAIKKHFGVEE